MLLRFFGIFLVIASVFGEGVEMKPTVRGGKQTHVLCVCETRCLFLALALSGESFTCSLRFGSRAFILGGGGGEEFSVWKQEVSVWES